ncbi:MAG TPA: GxxExxY protein [Methanocorpusculum sp.]|nr:GxxExxY protein [Methanocorpusculum sp.]HJJ80979.1 GxxExxY protein [Methanocorpusculum sp.]
MTQLKLIEGTDEYRIAGLAMKVRNELGFAMLESAYERALILELNRSGFTAERQVPIRIFYDGKELNHGYCADIVVDRRIILELKAVTRLYAIHRRQLQFYLSAGGIDSGLLINFGNYQKLECERMERADRRKRGELGVNPNGIFRPFSEEEKKNPHESFAERIARIVEMDEGSETSGGDA